MTWRLSYGEDTVSLEAPAEFTARTLAPAPITPLLDPVQAVRDALDSPSGGQRLRDLAAGARHVLLVVPARPGTGLPTVLPQVLDVLQDSGVGLRQVEILVAGGLRGRLEADEAEAIVGAEVWNRVVVRQHDCDAGPFTDLGTTELDTPLMLSRKAAESGQLLVLCGTIAPDAYAGFEGGPRLIMPGLASRAAGLHNARLALCNPPDMGIYEGCAAGEMEGNPVHEDGVEATDKVDPDFLVHTIIDEAGRMVKVLAGEWRKTYEAGCDWLRARMRVHVQEPRTWALVSAGGPTRDGDFLRAHHALLHAAVAVKDGGHLVFVAKCAGGFGPGTFEKWMGLSRSELEKAVRAEFDLSGRAALAVRQLCDRVTVHLVSELPAAQVEKLGMKAHASLDAAWAAVQPGLAEDAPGYLVPDPGHALLHAAWRREGVVEPRPLA